MEIIAETRSGINTPLYDSIALHIVAVRRIFSDDPGHRPPAGQEKATLRRLALSLRNILFAPKVLLRAAPLSSFNFPPQNAIFFAPSQRFFTFSLFWSRMNKNALSYRDSLMKLQCVFRPQRYFHQPQAGFLLIELLFSLPSDSKKAAPSRLGESRFLFTC